MIYDKELKYIIPSREEQLRRELEVESNINKLDDDGNTLLMRFCSQSCPRYSEENVNDIVEVIKRLLEDEEADPSIKNNNGKNALMMFLEGNSNYLLHNLLKEVVEGGAKPAFGFDRLLGSVKKFIYINGFSYYQGSPEFDKNQLIIQEWIKDLNNGIDRERPDGVEGPSSRFVYDDSRLEEYEEFLKQEISKRKLLIAKEIIPSLLKAGINIDDRDNNDRTPLMIANSQGEGLLEQILLDNGANEFDLKRADPNYRYLFDPKDEMNIFHRRGIWSKYIESVINIIEKVRIIENSEGESCRLPLVQLNKKDNSISFFISNEIQPIRGTNISSSQLFINSVTRKEFTEQLKFQVRKNDIKVIGDKEILEVISYDQDDMAEYKFNLSPEDLGSILKLNPTYGYKGENGIESFSKSFKLEDGFIRLFPVDCESFSDGNIPATKLIPKAEGCQFFEIPTVQLLHLLPNYESEIKPRHQAEDERRIRGTQEEGEKGSYFHWVPKDITDILLLDREEILYLIESILSDNGIDSKSTDFIELLTVKDPTKQSSIRIIEMYDDAKDYYDKYGNYGRDTLKNCKSLEVDTEVFLKKAKEYLMEIHNYNSSAEEGSLKDDSGTVFNRTETSSEQKTNAFLTFDIMIQKEIENKASKPLGSTIEPVNISRLGSDNCCTIS